MREKKAINIQIGEQIRFAREQAKLTQEQFAERIEVSPQYISDLERGVVGISIPTLKRACVALGVSSDRILFGAVSENRNAAIEKYCANLSDEDFAAILNMVDTFSTAIKKARLDKQILSCVCNRHIILLHKSFRDVLHPGIVIIQGEGIS